MARTEQARFRLDMLIVMVITAAVTLLQARMLSFLVLAGLLVAYLLGARLKYRWQVIMTGSLFVVSLSLPVDVSLGGYYWGTRIGSSPGGPHLVRFVVGLPARTKLIQKYGEFISAGCTWPAPFPPEWVLVWN